jgi:hypothetical protein
MNHPIFTRAEEFIWKNARLIDRRRFAYHFKNGSREDVLAALCGYQNADGGFGNALEPDIRCPDSQPVPAQHALEIMDEVGLDEEIVARICSYLVTITTPEGGVPFVLPTALAYPRAPWWETDDHPPASLNPTAAIAGLLHKHGIQHAWLPAATEFCRSKISNLVPSDMNEMVVVLTFLSHFPDRQWAERELDRLVPLMFAAGLVADVHADGYVRKPLEWAPAPEHPFRKYLQDEVIQANLAALITEQQADGGWGITWPPVSPACELEWRGWITLEKLKTLQAFGMLES